MDFNWKKIVGLNSGAFRASQTATLLLSVSSVYVFHASISLVTCSLALTVIMGNHCFGNPKVLVTVNRNSMVFSFPSLQTSRSCESHFWFLVSAIFFFGVVCLQFIYFGRNLTLSAITLSSFTIVIYCRPSLRFGRFFKTIR